MPLVVGLAGTYCSGKSSLGKALELQGARQIDVDKLGHQALQDMASQIKNAFGTNDRAELAKQVFSDPNKLSLLESIVHPRMVQTVAEEIARLKAETSQTRTLGTWQYVIIVNAAILLKMQLDKVCDLVIILDAPWIIRLMRGLRRDKKGLMHTLRRMAQQEGLFTQQAQHCADIHRVRSRNLKGFLNELKKIEGLPALK